MTPINRNRLFQALNGDFDLMTRLIIEWDIEAQILKEKGTLGIRRLERKTLLSLLRNPPRDDHKSTTSFFPQTYLSAGILLALTDGSFITALPKGINGLTHIYSPEKLDRVTYSADPKSLEAIGTPESTLAFISPYSDPCTVRAMKQRGMTMIDLGTIADQTDLKKAIQTVGRAAGSEAEAFILNTFIDAAMLACDNHLATKTGFYSKVLYLNHHTVFSAPTQKTLLGTLLKRLKINEDIFAYQSEDWDIPLEIEDIAAINPDYIIFSGDSKSIKSLNALTEMNAAKKGQIYFVDQAVQETSSQHFLLGYYDLYDILMRIP